MSDVEKKHLAAELLENIPCADVRVMTSFVVLY